MNKRIIAVVVALAVIIVAAVAILAAQNSNGSTEPNSSTSESQTGEGSNDQTRPAVENDGAGAYVDYSPTAVADADGRVILFFHATWCPQCVSIDGDIKAQGVPSGVTIVKVDYDANQALRAEYGVTQQTTFVEVDASGEKLQDNFVAYSDPQLQTVLDALL
ncbi:MAG: thioredoxin family protein [Rhodoglobus sp.]